MLTFFHRLGFAHPQPCRNRAAFLRALSLMTIQLRLWSPNQLMKEALILQEAVRSQESCQQQQGISQAFRMTVLFPVLSGRKAARSAHHQLVPAHTGRTRLSTGVSRILKTKTLVTIRKVSTRAPSATSVRGLNTCKLAAARRQEAHPSPVLTSGTGSRPPSPAASSGARRWMGGRSCCGFLRRRT